MARLIDLSADLGEASSDQEQIVENEIWTLITSANVACGGHAGDEATMRRAVREAKHLGVILGAHPSYPDREHFGRRTMILETDLLIKSLIMQIQALQRAAREEDLELAHVKPHGALYNDAHHDRALADAIISAIVEVDPLLAVVAAPGSELGRAATVRRLTVIPEAFADRRYRPDGSLVPRSEHASLLLDLQEASTQASRLVLESIVLANNGAEIAISFTTLCIHADMEHSAKRLRTIRNRLESEGFVITSAAREPPRF